MSEDVFNLLTITGTCTSALAAHGLQQCASNLQPFETKASKLEGSSELLS